MKIVTVDDMQQLYRPPRTSHKGQNGRLLVIGGSKLFHSSVFWAADVASRIVDLVHFSSPAMENNELVRQKAKEKFWNGIVVPWENVEEYIVEDDCVVIGPGMVRRESISENSENSEIQKTGKSDNQIIRNSETLTLRQTESSEFSEMLRRVAKIDDTAVIVNTLLKKYPHKRWVIDGGALQEMDVNSIPEKAILTPHHKEWEGLLTRTDLVGERQSPSFFAKKYKCVIVLKGSQDVVCDENKCVDITGGNEGMTKGGTGDVLAGLIGALYCKNDAWLAATEGSYINKKAGDNLYQRVGPFFNASDLVTEVPKVLVAVW